MRTARGVASLGTELVRVAAGRSELRPRGATGASPTAPQLLRPRLGDQPLFRRLLQTHLAVEGTVDGLISDAGLD